MVTFNNADTGYAEDMFICIKPWNMSKNSIKMDKRMKIRFLFVLHFYFCKNGQVAQTGSEAQWDEQALVKHSGGGTPDGHTTVLSHPAVSIRMNSSNLCKNEFAVSRLGDNRDGPSALKLIY